jgi:hypothetical protein
MSVTTLRVMGQTKIALTMQRVPERILLVAIMVRVEIFN